MGMQLKPSLDIEQHISDMENKLRELMKKKQDAQEEYSDVRMQQAELKRQIAELELKRIPTKSILDRAGYLVRDMEEQIKILTKKFWHQKKAGL